MLYNITNYDILKLLVEYGFTVDTLIKYFDEHSNITDNVFRNREDIPNKLRKLKRNQEKPKSDNNIC